MASKKVDTNQYVSMLRELTGQGQKVSIPISGNSMYPFLVPDRDYISFVKPNKKLCVGDMVFYQRRNGQYIMHRICKVKPEGYYLIGDGQLQIEGPVQKEQIFALITDVKRNGEWIGTENIVWKFFACVWIRMIRVRRIVFGVKKKIRRYVSIK